MFLTSSKSIFHQWIISTRTSSIRFKKESLLLFVALYQTCSELLIFFHFKVCQPKTNTVGCQLSHFSHNLILYFQVGNKIWAGTTPRLSSFMLELQPHLFSHYFLVHIVDSFAVVVLRSSSPCILDVNLQCG